MGKISREIGRIKNAVFSVGILVVAAGFLISIVPRHFFIWLGAALGIGFFIWLISKNKWSSGKYINSDGYVVLLPSHELEHRYLARQVIGRELDRNEIVHHINGIKTDNEIQNLCLMDREKHEHFHSWLSWKKQKSGKYPSFRHQRRALMDEYGGTLLDSVVPVNKEIYRDSNECETTMKDLPKLTEEDLKRLFNELRKERKRIAVEENIPAYLVLKDFTLREMVERMPQNRSELKEIIGWNTEKLKMYGENFVAVIERFKSELAAKPNTDQDSA